MKINILTIYYALGATMLDASIHELSADTHFEVDDLQIDVDQEVDVVSCCLLLDTPTNLVYNSILYHILTSFGFHNDPNCTR
jgi:hypothetical protein